MVSAVELTIPVLGLHLPVHWQSSCRLEARRHSSMASSFVSLATLLSLLVLGRWLLFGLRLADSTIMRTHFPLPRKFGGPQLEIEAELFH